jgi:hypothetical protein
MNCKETLVDPERMFSLKRPREMVAHLVEALRYKPEGRGFDSLWDY